jgi:DNA polymerase (family 10)
MENIEIAGILNQYADLLDIQGENQFRVRSYRQAARTIEGLSRPVTELLDDQKELRSLPGVGARMVEHLQEIVETGSLPGLRDVRKELPETMAELVHLEGLGPKRAKQLHDELGIASASDLRKALDSGDVEQLTGFGKKSAEKLGRALGRRKQQGLRFKLSDADQLIQPLLDHLSQTSGIERMDVAGSYRRRKETVGDADILVACEKSQPVMKQFRSYPEVERVEMAGKTRGAVVLGSGIHVDLRIVPRHCYGAALHYFTGSKEHSVALRKLGVERGLSISEYGVFRVPKGKKAEKAGKRGGKKIGGEKEEDVFRAVGMDWVPPELREHRGEIEAAQEHNLPHLITVDDIRGDLHMHSKWTDGGHTIEEMAKACRKHGYAYCAITDHSKATRVAGGLDTKDFRKQWKEIEQVRKKLDGIVLLAGVEVDILPDGSLDLPAKFLAQFDIVVASVHSQLNMDKKAMTRKCSAPPRTTTWPWNSTRSRHGSISAMSMSVAPRSWVSKLQSIRMRTARTTCGS